jgi:hypothetical protein
MNTAAQPAAATPSKPWMLWTGRVLSALPFLSLVMAAVMGWKGGPESVEGMKRFGWGQGSAALIGMLALPSALLYAIPRTAVFGAILMTGYFGGAIATHLRISDPGWPMALAMGVLTWLGLYLRDARIRRLLPLRASE